jgi:rhodanese-related sulfurtransferase
MSTPTAAISSTELRDRLDSPTAPTVLDVRTPAEFETAHITRSYNVPLDVLGKNTSEVVEKLDGEVVLVCKSGQRAAEAATLLRDSGRDTARILQGGLTDWERNGFAVQRGIPRWELERQVRLVAGSIVLSSVLGSVAIPKLKWVAAAIGGGLTFAAVTNSCAMAAALSKLPYNRGEAADGHDLVPQLAPAVADT